MASPEFKKRTCWERHRIIGLAQRVSEILGVKRGRRDMLSGLLLGIGKAVVQLQRGAGDTHDVRSTREGNRRRGPQ